MVRKMFAKGTLGVTLIIMVILSDYTIQSYLGRKIADYYRISYVYVKSNPYGLYIRYPGSTNFYNIYPTGIYEITDDYKKIRQIDPKEVETKLDMFTGIRALGSYFNILPVQRNGIKFWAENNIGYFYFKVAKTNKNVIVSIEYNQGDLILDKNRNILNKPSTDTTALIRINSYLRDMYNTYITNVPMDMAKFTNIFENEGIYIYNPGDNLIIKIPNIPQKQTVKAVGDRFIEIDLLGKDTLQIEILKDIKEIR